MANNDDDDSEEFTDESSNASIIHCAPNKKRRKNQCTLKETRSKPKYAIRNSQVPRRIFDRTVRRLRQKKSLIDRKDQTAAKAACDRYVFSEIHHAEVGKNLNETIIPESSTHVILEIRKCIQRKEYGDAAKLISAYTQLAVGKMRWYQSLIRYALICLLYDPVIQGSGLLDMFLEGVIMCRNVEEKEQFLKEITHFPKTIHSTRRCFGKLWKEKEDKKESNVSPMNVEKLCAALSRQTNEDVDDDDADYDENNSEWESYSESSSSSAEEVETTEVENVIDINETLDKLKDELFI